MAAICLRRLSLLLVLLAGAASAAHNDKPAPEPAPAADCFSMLMNLASCLQYVMLSSELSRPSSDCCKALTSLLDSDEQSGTHTASNCMCDAFNGKAAGIAVQVDRTRAMNLPVACYASNYRNCTEAPAPAPVGPPTTTAPPTSSTGDHSSSGSSSLVASLQMLLCTTIFIAIFMHRPHIELS